MKVIEAIKKIYPTIQGGFVYWETQQDLTPWENPIDGLVWENTEFAKPTWEQIEAQLSIVDLQEAKTAKINQLKLNRNAHNLSSMDFVQAKEITFDEFGFDVITDNEVYFKFNVSATGQPTSEPSSLILGYINRPVGYLRYSCVIIEEGKVRKGYIKFNQEIAIILEQHISRRYTDAIKHTNDIEKDINACTTIEEVNAININF